MSAQHGTETRIFFWMRDASRDLVIRKHFFQQVGNTSVYWNLHLPQNCRLHLWSHTFQVLLSKSSWSCFRPVWRLKKKKKIVTKEQPSCAAALDQYFALGWWLLIKTDRCNVDQLLTLPTLLDHDRLFLASPRHDTLCVPAMHRLKLALSAWHLVKVKMHPTQKGNFSF